MTRTVLQHRRRLFSRIGVLTLALIVGVFCVPLGVSAQDTGTVTGTILDENQKPLPGAQVVVVGTQRGSVTDSEGSYTISGAPTGQIQVQAKFVGYKSRTKSVTLDAGETVTVDFQLVPDLLEMEGAVVTGSFSERSKMESSVAVTTLNAAKIEEQNAQSISDLMKSVPGLWVESSGGQGGNNVFTRGLPSAGKLTFVELNHNGLPVLELNDLDFGNTDQFFRSDKTIQTMEAVRGGTASIFAASAPAAIMNFRSKTGGEELGGTFKLEAGTAANTQPGRMRADFNIGGPMGEDWKFNVGGFYRFDEGVRDPGFTGNKGGQISANVTRFLDNGYVRAYGRYMNDQNIFYLPIPLQNQDDPEGIPGFDANYSTFANLDAATVRVPGPDATPGSPNFVTRDLTEGIHPELGSFQVDVVLDITENLSLENKAKVMETDMTFNAPFSLGNVPGAGQQPVNAIDFAEEQAEDVGISNPGPSNFNYSLAARDGNFNPTAGNGLVAQVGWWHVKNDLSGFINETELSYDVEFFGQHSWTGGLYISRTSRDELWHWNNMLLEVRDTPRMLDLTLTADDGETYQVTQNGFTQFGTLHNESEGTTTIAAGYFGDEWEVTDALRIDVAGRIEKSVFRGRAGGFNSRTINIDGDPNTLFDNGVAVSDDQFSTFNQSETEWAFSGGLNYDIADQYAVFGRFSRGFHMPDLDDFRGGQAEPIPIRVFQGEVGFKATTPNFGLFITGFWSRLLDQQFTAQAGENLETVSFRADTRTPGVEIEFNGQYGNLNASVTSTIQDPTFTDAETGAQTTVDITDDRRIQRQPRFLASFNPRYELNITEGLDLLEIGSEVRFIDSRFTDAANQSLKLPSYVEWNGSVTARQGDVTVKFTGSNLTNSIGLTEGNPRGGILEAPGVGEVFQARPILGRRFNISLQYDF